MDSLLPNDLSSPVLDIDDIHELQVSEARDYSLVPVESKDKLNARSIPLSEEEEKVVFMIRDGKTISQIRKELGKKENQQINSILVKEHVAQVLRDIDMENRVLMNANTEMAIQTAVNLMKYGEKEETRLSAAKIFINRHEKKEEIEAKSKVSESSSSKISDFLNKVADSAANARANVTVNIQNNIGCNE